MDATEIKPFLFKILSTHARHHPGFIFSPLNFSGNHGLLLLLLVVFLLAGCKTVPVMDRNLAEAGGLWELNEHTGARFHLSTVPDDATIGLIQSSGKNVLLNGSSVNEMEQVKNHSFVSSGPRSGARIRLKSSGSSCLIRVDDFKIGNAFTETSDCEQRIETLHAIIHAKNAILHLNVSQHETEVTVISGTISVTSRGNPTDSIDINEDHEVTVTLDTVSPLRSITSDEIWQRIRWRDDFRIYKTVIDWNKVIAGAVTVAIIAVVIIFGKGRSGVGQGSGFPRHR
ncbi:hypothetical protein [Nitrosomonas ureae]|uniref:Uncharacterized protein n=1 Tax=Nitrosomonas ureae TaxID=44577 RepID=A0A1H2EZL8_9PROT|nr:hypothetical protein [Nitrosomonas ureae]ALQ50927.1 hypothetical protein ATY38_06605 [Nitrosomonas ureae]SDU00525.1 hypothetical protein SAMN05216406_11662 [Nitrosomonas ureae]